ITAVTGAHPASGLASVAVTNPGNSSGSLSNAYFYNAPSGALSFYTVTPCRVIDTRNPNGPLGGPALTAGGQRTFAITGQCGLPAGAKMVSANVSITGPAASGFLGLFPGNALFMGTSSISFSPGQTRSSNTLLELSTDGSGTFGVLNGAAGAV